MTPFPSVLEARGITQAQLSREASIPRSTISEVLSGKKRFSRQMIRKLATYFKVEVSVVTGQQLLQQFVGLLCGHMV